MSAFGTKRTSAGVIAVLRPIRPKKHIPLPTMCRTPDVTRSILLSQLSCRAYAKGRPWGCSHRVQSSRNGLSNASNRAHVLDPHCDNISRQLHRCHRCCLVALYRECTDRIEQSNRGEPVRDFGGATPVDPYATLQGISCCSCSRTRSTHSRIGGETKFWGTGVASP